MPDPEHSRDLDRGLEPGSSALVHRGLDLARPTEITPDEIQAFKDHYAAQFGVEHEGLDWWLDKSPEVLKRYRLFASLSLRVQPALMGHGYIAYYALLGFETGVLYCVRSLQRAGLSKAQTLEAIALAFVLCGPRGMDTIARALAGYELVDTPAVEAVFPAGWAPDPEAFQSGIDFSDPRLTPAELDRVVAWYQSTLGEVPPYVSFLGRHRPELLKAYRNRFENTLRTLPKQMWPTTMLFFHCLTRAREGMRENVLLCRAFGVSREDTLTIIGNSLVYGDMQAAGLAEQAAGDVFAGW